MKSIKNKIYHNISIRDFDEKFNSFKTVSQKFEFLNDYILSYGMDNNPLNKDESIEVDFPLEYLVSHACARFCEAVYEARTNYEKKSKNPLPKNVIDPLDKSQANHDKQKAFILNPLEYTLNNMISIRDNLDLKKTDPEYKELGFWNMNLNRNILNARAVHNFEECDSEYGIKDFNKRVGEKVYNNPFLDSTSLINLNKGGFFERFFRTTSYEYNNFVETYKAFNDKNSEGYGNINNLEAAARVYLYHKIPNFGPEDKYPNDRDIQRLSGTARKRVDALVGILKTIEDERKMLSIVENAEQEENNQELFHSDLDISLNESMEFQNDHNEIDNQNIIDVKEIDSANKEM